MLRYSMIQLIWDMLRVLHGFGPLVKRQDFWIPCARSPGLLSTAEWPGHWRGCAGQGCVTSAGGGSPWWTGNIGRSGETQWILAEQLRWENLAEGRSGCFGKGLIQADYPWPYFGLHKGEMANLERPWMFKFPWRICRPGFAQNHLIAQESVSSTVCIYTLIHHPASSMCILL